MKIQSEGTMAVAVKVGVSRQVVIPKKIHDELGLSPGDYLAVELDRAKRKVTLTPKTLVDKPLDRGLAGALEDYRQGRVYGPFSSTKELLHSLHRETRKRSKKH